MNSSFLTLSEYAREQGVTLQTCYRRVWQGQVRAEKVLGRWLIEPPDKEPAPTADRPAQTVGLAQSVPGPVPAGESKGQQG